MKVQLLLVTSCVLTIT